MKNKVFCLISVILLAISSLCVINSCRERDDTVNCFPNSLVSVTLNLSLSTYFNLQNIGGWIYVDEQSPGTNGLIVVRTTNGFMVYDRNAPHLCPESSTILEVQEDIRLYCPKDGAEWILLTGQPIRGTALAPKMYPYNYEPSTNTLTIYN